MSKITNVKNAKKITNKVRKNVLAIFFKVMNDAIADGERTINTGLGKFSSLNDAEFEKAVYDAQGAGWILTRFEDNYQSTSYKIEEDTDNN